MPGAPSWIQPLERERPAPRHLVGRTAELQQLLGHARRPRPEGPGIAVVSGATGMGKTALLRRLAEELAGAGVLVLSVGPGGSEPMALYGQLMAALGSSERATAEGRPHALGQRLLEALITAGAGRPLTVIIDDVHRADVESSLALGFATRRLYGQQLLFVLATRSPDEIGVEPNVRRIMPARGDILQIRLPGLTAAQIKAMAHAFGVIPFSMDDAEIIRDHSGGNPRYVSRLLDQIRRDPHVRSARRPIALSSVTAGITAQVEDLPEASRLLLSALAVLDDRCPLVTVARVAGMPEPFRALEPLLAAGLVEWWPAEPTTPVRIRTPLQQQVTYQAISPRIRQLLHRRAARAVPPGQALRHRMLAVQDGPDRALADDLAAAAWRWTVEGSLDRAAQHLLWAARVSEPGPSREQRMLLGVSLLQRAGQNEAAAALRERVRRCPPSPMRGCVMGRFAMIDGDLAVAQDLLEAAIAEVERDRRTPDFAAVAAIGYTWLAVVHTQLGESARARYAAGRCLAVSPFGRRIDRGSELLYISATCELDGPTIAMQRLRELVDLPAAPSEVDPADAMLLIQRGHFRLLTGEPADAVADIEAGLRTARNCGLNDLDDWAHCWASAAHMVLGSFDKAADHAKAALDIELAEGRPHVAHMLAVNAFVEAFTGQLAAATEHASASADLAENFCPPADRLFPAMAVAAIARARVDPLGVVEALEPFASWTKGWLRVYRWLWWPTYVDALLDLGRIDRARAELAAMAGEIAVGYRVLVVPHQRLCGRAAEAEGDLPAARAAYQQAINAASTLASPQSRARAAESYQRIAANPAPAGSWAQSLTARERAIAGLIADGLSNRAVSRCLGITEKTTEAHLTRVYRKLAVKSRHELRAALHGGRKAGPSSAQLAPCARSGSQSSGPCPEPVADRS